MGDVAKRPNLKSIDRVNKKLDKTPPLRKRHLLVLSGVLAQLLLGISKSTVECHTLSCKSVIIVIVSVSLRRALTVCIPISTLEHVHHPQAGSGEF
jgi:hypothetical protein